MSKHQTIYLLIGSGLFLLGFIPVQQCVTKQAAETTARMAQLQVGNESYSYQINVPSKTVLLPPILREISGLSLSDDPDLLLAVQDEEGRVYYVSKETGNVERQLKFGGSDDYEGIELMGDVCFVVNSKGNFDVFKLEDGAKDKKQTAKTFLSSDYDVEGLGKLPGQQGLLVACKSARSKKDRNRKIFRMNSTTLELDTVPFLVLDYQAISEALGRPQKSPIFSPSGIAVHPLSGDIYIISSAANALVIYSSKGVMKSSVELSKAIHPQPEGITIDLEGHLYISSEGRDDSAKLHIFYPA